MAINSMPGWDECQSTIVNENMDYGEIIQQNIKHHARPSWWCKYAFHFTDVSNAASILRSGRLYSRRQALNHNVMMNDNASRQVIDITDSEVISNVRFYFRPQTPTQYYNEGYKHPLLRFHGDPNANVPVPVFFLFDLEKLLTHPDVEFSEVSQAGHRATTCKGIEAFSRFNFNYIYDNTYDNFSITKNYRQAEILIPNHIDINNYLSYVLCRNSIEQTTLLNLLRSGSADALEQYKNFIRVCKADVFYDNGIYVNSCECNNDSVYVTLSDSYESYQYNRREMLKQGLTELRLVEASICIEWLDDGDCMLKQARAAIQVDIQKTKELHLRSLPVIPGATKLGIRVFFEKKLMCYVIRSLMPSELLE